MGKYTRKNCEFIDPVEKCSSSQVRTCFIIVNSKYSQLRGNLGPLGYTENSFLYLVPPGHTKLTSTLPLLSPESSSCICCLNDDWNDCCSFLTCYSCFKSQLRNHPSRRHLLILLIASFHCTCACITTLKTCLSLVLTFYD